MVIDTNIIIAYLKGESGVVAELDGWREERQTLLISSVTFSEVLSYPTLQPAEVDEARDYLNTFIAVPFDNTLGEIAAALRRLYRLAMPDAAIAATAVKYGVPLVTRDQDFRAIKEVQIVAI